MREAEFRDLYCSVGFDPQSLSVVKATSQVFVESVAKILTVGFR